MSIRTYICKLIHLTPLPEPTSIIGRGTPVALLPSQPPADGIELDRYVQRLNRLVQALQDSDHWADANHQLHSIPLMTREHALNTLVFLHENFGAAPAYTPLTDALRRRILS